MALFVWTSIFVWLMFELIAMFVLVTPVPRKTRNIIRSQIGRWNTVELFHTPLWFIKFGPIIGFVISYNQRQGILECTHKNHHHYHHDVLRCCHLDKQQTLKCERICI